MILVRLLILSTVLGLTACMEKKPGELVFEDKNNPNPSGPGINIDPRVIADSVPTFQQSVYPIVRSNCINCHSSNMAPFFAQADVKLAHDVALSSFKVNLGKPEASRLYLRLKNDQHNCWSNCEDNAAEMLDAIKYWASKTNRNITGIKTVEKGFNEANRITTTISNKTFFEFEDGVRSGRFYEVVNQSASGLKLLTTAKVSQHPLGEISTRYGEVATGCRTDIPLNEYSRPSDQRPYRVYNKISRHPDPNGYPPYALRMRFWPIRPDRRMEYLALLKLKGTLTPEDLRRFLWRASGFYSNDTSNEMVGFNDGSLNPIFLNSAVSQYYGGLLGYAPILLPDGLSVEEYNDAQANGTLADDYFAPRYDSNFYIPKGKEVRQVLSRLQSTSNFIQRAIYAPLAIEFRNQYMGYDGTVRDDTQTLPSGALFFSGGARGSQAFETIFPLRWEDAGNVIYNQDGNVIHEIDKYVYIETNLLDHTFRNNNVTFPIDYATRTPNRDVRFAPSNINNSISQTISEYKPTQLPRVEWYATGRQKPTMDEVYDINDVQYPNKDVDKALEAFNESKYQSLILPIVTAPQNSCLNCHGGQNTSSPAFATTDVNKSYQVAKSIFAFNLTNVASSKFYSQMKAYHNCGGAANCNPLATTFLNAITSWKTAYDAEKLKYSNSQTFQKVFTTAEQTPGVVKFKFRVPATTKYKMLARVKMTDPAVERYDPIVGNYQSSKPPFFSYQLFDQNNNPVALTKQDNTQEASTCNKALLQYVYVPNPDNQPSWEQREWKWISSGTSFYNLPPGEYTLNVIEGREGMELDEIGFTSELTDLIDTKPAKSEDPVAKIPTTPLNKNIFEFDISGIVNVPGSKFKMHVSDYYGYYKIAEPTITSPQKIWVKDLQVMVNGLPSLNDASYRTVARVVEANSAVPLSNVPLLVLKENGKISDKMSALFGQLRKATATDTNSIPPVRNSNPGKVCTDLPYFEKNILPIFLMNIWPEWAIAGQAPYYEQAFGWENYNAYYAMRFLHTYNRMSIYLRVTESFNRCIDCHNPNTGAGVKFNMTRPNPSGSGFAVKDSAELCSEVMKRVYFSEPEMSPIFRSINGQFGHPRILFPEVPVVDGNKEWPNNPDSWNGKSSTWNTGTVLSTYTDYNDLFDPNSSCRPQDVTSSAEISYLKKFVGTYKRKHFVFHEVASPAINYVKTVHDINREAAQLAPVSLTFYEDVNAPISIEERKNFTKKLYPGEYGCSNIPFNNRISPQSVQAVYPGTNYSDSYNHPALTAPDGTKLMRSSGSTATNPSTINILHEMNRSGQHPDFELGKEALRNIIIKWIEHERDRQ
ncbi:MAG TPA: hypothetical protein VNJ01_16135 [Bacteriovoracaceae bacterium]|nr:hypothetical protein [Bacteriovoracaceae bacterium]